MRRTTGFIAWPVMPPRRLPSFGLKVRTSIAIASSALATTRAIGTCILGRLSDRRDVADVGRELGPDRDARGRLHAPDHVLRVVGKHREGAAVRVKIGAG